MTDPVRAAERSSKLKALDQKYRKLREQRAGQVQEPDNTGLRVEDFIKLSTLVAESYTPSKYLESAPLPK
ncbi:MAG TPA: hypothetical protein VHU18_03425 [Rhizomicrobium sp.]|nr:hypothetical protein [Rhizomicrobium sp.]